VVAAPTRLVEGALKITVRTRDGRRLPAERIEADPKTKITLLRVEAQGLPATPVVASADLSPGAEVLLGGLCAQECAHPRGAYVTKLEAKDGSLVCLLRSEPRSAGLAWLLDGEGRALGVAPRLTRLPMPLGGALWLATATPLESLKARIDAIPPRPAPTLEPWEWLWKEPDWPAPWEWSWVFPPPEEEPPSD